MPGGRPDHQDRVMRASATSTSAGARVLVRADLNVPLDGRAGRRRHPHPGGAAHHRAVCSTAARRWSLCSHLGRPKGEPQAGAVAAARWPTGSPSCSAGRSPSATSRASLRLLENLRFDPREEAQRPRLRRRAGGPGRPVRQRRVRRRPPRPRLDRGRRPPAARGRRAAARGRAGGLPASCWTSPSTRSWS